MEPNLISGSAPSVRSEADLFSVPASDVSIISSDHQPYFPIVTITDTNLIQFSISGSNTHYLDLNNSHLYMKCRLVNKDGTTITTAKCAVGNLFFHTFFQNVQITLNGVLVEDSNNMYAFTSWLQRQLSFGYGQKKAALTNELYYNNRFPDNFDITQNADFKEHYETCKDSKTFEVLGNFCTSVTQQKKYLLPNVEVGITLRRNPPEFYLDCAADTTIKPDSFKVIVDDAIFYARRHLLNPQLSLAHQQRMLKGETAKYSCRRTELKTFALPTGSFGSSGQLVFTGPVPELVVVCATTSEAFRGALSKSPFNFQHFNIQEISINVDDDPSMFRTLQLDFNSNVFLRGYNSLFKAVKDFDEGNLIPRQDYSEGNVIYVFEILPIAGNGLFSQERDAQIKVELKFSTALTAPINVMVLGQFQSLIQIDQNKNVYNYARR